LVGIQYSLFNGDFVFARSQAVGIRARIKFADKYQRGSIFTLNFPDGSVARFLVGAASSGVPLVAEAPNSC